MICLQPCRNQPYQRFVSQAVSTDRSAAQLKVRVAINTVGYPQPAAITLRLYFGPEARRKSGITEAGSGKIRLHRKTPSDAMQPEVIGLAAAFIIAAGGSIA